ncbi:MAG: BatD family protein, partial [Flavobacteriaceae bacterium]
LYPQKTGTLELEPLTLSLNVDIPSNRRDLFGNRLSKQIQKTITAGGVNINVKPLPLQGQPPNFSGAVGQFDFDVILSKQTLKATESFQAKVKVRGNGNLKLFDLPKITVPNTLELYEPEHSEQVKTTLKGMQGSIEDSYTIVPQYQGKYPISPLSFSYFDPKRETYRTLQSQKLIVDVFDGPVAGNPAIANSAQMQQQNYVTPESAFRFISLDTSLDWIEQESFWKSNGYWGMALSPFLTLLLLFFVRKQNRKNAHDEQQIKQRAANRLARKYLSSAKAQLNNQAAFYEALERALHNYLKAKLSLETQEFSKSKIKMLLASRQVSQNAAAAFVELLENCEQARYAPGTTVNMTADYQNASSIIAILDKELK